jgi:threonine dehydrogenase-like Zn-dependent dehydrogenase
LWLAIIVSSISDHNTSTCNLSTTPKFENPAGKKIEHAVILKVVSTNICGSDQHMVRGRTQLRHPLAGGQAADRRGETRSHDLCASTMHSPHGPQLTPG